jgi:hypothetical protein
MNPMNTRNLNVALLLLILTQSPVLAQDDLMDLLGEEKPATEYAHATFKSTRLVLGQSVENPASGTLQFLIQHNFGRINQGAYDLFGLDQSTIRLGLEYGINELVCVSLGRSNFEKTIDGAVKIKLMRQSTGARKNPLSVSFYANSALNTAKWKDETRKNYFSSRLAYTHQLLIARKFSNAFSLQLSPTLIHKNLVAGRTDPNDIYALGAGGRIKVTQRTTLNAEYFHVFNGNESKQFKDALSIGCDIETGGHVFQFRLTNAQPMFERAFITETAGDWADGDIYFGFTINRVFTIVRPKAFKSN